MPSARRDRILFLLFFVSGLCGLTYQLVWVRLAYAAFGIITPVLSVVLSTFMLGLALGSWGAGRWVEPWSRRTGLSAIAFYAVAEAVIGGGAFVVPWLFQVGEAWLLPLGDLDSASYLLWSGLLLGASILPWCVAMGATFPLVMAFVKEVDRGETTGFSFLYLANVIGAMTGTALTAVALIELLGFRGTLGVAAALNFSVAVVAVWLALRHPLRSNTLAGEPAPASAVPGEGSERMSPRRARLVLAILFLTGFCSLAAEVIWVRNFLPILGAFVYSFALILFVYLLATWIGSWLYRRHVQAGRVASTPALAAWLAVVAWLPIVIPDPRITQAPLLLGASVFPYCALLGYLTPKLVDLYSQGFPRGGGRAYAVNVVGSILGPLFASYLLLPWLGARVGLVVLALPFVVLFFGYRRSPALGPMARAAAGTAALVLMVVSLSLSRSFEEGPRDASQVRRDHTATVISSGTGFTKKLLVNGIYMTRLLPVAKVMAHLPLATLDHEPESALVVALGMGTTFRSLVSWGIDTTAVELVTSVRDAFPYYFGDAEALLARPNARVVIDDGRRFLRRVDARYDVVTVDPAPPVEAVGSSLLYSVEFLELVKQRLRPGGILHHWFPGGEPLIQSAVARSLTRVFPHVRAYRSIQGWGVHFLASEQPFRMPSPEQFVARMPDSARRDLVEWNPVAMRDPKAFAGFILSLEVPLEKLLDPDPRVVITDDRPFNEYFLLRRSTGESEPGTER